MYLCRMGKLILIPTPIGNLQDITLRAIDTLKAVDAVLAEDTRVSGRLLQHLGIRKPMIAYHQVNEHRIAEQLADRMAAGETFGMVTDAGTPGISDPGYLIVQKCLERQVAVECLPGPVAFIPALVVSGLPTDKFCFEGFLPHKKGRQTRLKALAAEERTIILYESPHRLLKTLQEMIPHFGDQRPVSVSREISKLYEETIRGTLTSVVDHFTHHPIKGEFVIVIGGR